MEDRTRLFTRITPLRLPLKTRRWLRPLLAVLIGAVAGYLYYHFIGCKGGSCPITGNPWISTITGAILGLFFVNSPCLNNKC